MQVATVLVLLVICELCLTIRVPSSWDQSASEVKQEIKNDNDEQFSVESFKPQIVNEKKSIPLEYFEYTAKKPQFAIDIAKFHGVQSPENHYTAYPIKPHTGILRPELGKHRIIDKDNVFHQPLQEYANINEEVVTHVVPVSSNYEVFHPYEAETPALQEIYKDPVLTKIRNDLENSKNRLQAYEKEAGEPDISKDEYLESPQKTDSKIGPHRNIPAPYEIHRPQRRPIYYRPVPITHHREQHLNQRLRHPWNQYSAKVRPIHYRPIKNHIHQLRQSHALKYDDERNEYPQVHILENYSDPKDGYDIYERGKDKFVQLRNNVDESINKAVKENRPATYEKLEVQNNGHSNDDNEEEFIPIKNYAQVRKTETFKHLPKSAALAEAETFDEIRNAPRLREAVKSTKAQTVYSEEGYEDSAYDHAGEQKHASENEGHGGFLKQHELSGGKYKTPSESAKYQDGGGSAYRDKKIHAEKWKEDNKDDKEQTDEEDYSEDENEKSIEDTYNDSSPDDGKRNKRENDIKNDTDTDFSDVILNYKTNESTPTEKQRIYFKVPELDLNSTFLSEQEILNLKKIINQAQEEDIIKQKYPYYSEKIRAISKHSPLRYAENLEYIPRKSKGGTEFYDSRSNFECPDVDDAPDPIPEKLKRDGHPDDNDDSGEESPSTKGDENYDTVKKTPRLKGLGDKIDCFKAKYFGENPLDSPFFKEEIISNPEPITPPNKLGLHHFKISIQNNEPGKAESRHVITEKKNVDRKPDIFDIIEKIRYVQSVPFNSEEKSKDEIMILNTDLKNSSNMDELKLKQQSRVYNDILENIYHGLDSQKRTNINSINITSVPNDLTTNLPKNITYVSYQNKEDITKAPHVLKKRSTTFIYEPYKIIRDSQIPDSKKTTTTNNISPLIRKLQSSRVVDRVVNTSQEIDKSEKHVKRNVNTPRMYKDIGRKERESSHGSKNDKGSVDPSFIDVSIDKRRGEPRYEIRRPVNHKTSYAPVENKKSMSIEDYKAQKNGDSHLKGETTTLRQQERTPVSKLISDLDIQNIAESSNTVRKTVSTTTPKPNNQPTRVQHESDESLEDYEEYEDVEEETEISTTTTTTQKPSFRRRMKPKTTTEHIVESTERPKLKLVTRFRDYEPEERSELQEYSIDKSQKNNHNVNKEQNKEIPDSVPKYREKKKKSTKSTLVTDTKRYGDDDSDMRKEEVDALIGVKQDMDDYIPLYEKEEKNKLKTKHPRKGSTEDNEKQTDDDDDEVDDNDSDTDNDDDSHEDNGDEDDDEDDEDYDEDEDNDSVERETEVTTPEPTKRTLEITTEAPTPTTAIRNAKLEAKPIVTRKKIEIHKELPANKSSPHTTEYKQDIKEVEIIKEIPMPPKKKPQKNLEAIELYKDDNLAKEINKLGSVEIFKEDIDLRNGPRHGGNYRQLEVPKESAPLKEKATKDAVASQSAFTKHVELEDDIPRHRMHGGNLKSLTDIHKSRSRGRSEKLIELSDSSSTAMHGGNLKIRNRGRNSGKNQKLIELDDDHDHDDDDSSSDSHESFNSNSRGSRPMHGGNYRSAKIIVQDKKTTKDDDNGSRDRGARRNAAAILNSFVQAVPILTTTPAYILDPSKRMYYYVDT